MKPISLASIAVACLGCTISYTDDSVEYIETDVPIYQADCRVECGGHADTCDVAWLSCGKCGEPCDANGRRGVCDTCCEGDVDTLRCRPIE